MEPNDLNCDRSKHQCGPDQTVLLLMFPFNKNRFPDDVILIIKFYGQFDVISYPVLWEL